ncbi:inorganic pyrophosphatase [Desulfocicer vacuolatum DSM 3385]|uniref:Inorganic pyrophosphatase n=1 Tax=Desulfocicer vacuolatum DSM 3385 TaxID=1121400 RepID=A0A1W2DKD8_9BACT|nr:inorganic pyrophosphatase Ppa [Desulfocicer vacuolatum]SMC97552.1 inorganic pyrophosphatase [Desulfocicer vacuolatum DSM 3385]
MAIANLVELKEKFEIQTYQKPQNVDKHNHIPFSGSPKKHPTNKSKVILIADPFTPNTFYYEFNIQDIAFAEELASITNLEGESMSMARIWVKKQSVGVRCTPFIVDVIKSH